MTNDQSNDVLDQELWQLVRSAITAVNVAIEQHRNRGGWVPTVRVPLMAAFDSGWPDVKAPVRVGNETPDYSRLFGAASTQDTPFAYDDIPELTDVIEYMTGRDDLLEKINFVPPGDAVSRETALDFARYEPADLVLSVVDRAWALGQPHDERTLLLAYKQRERSILATELEADVVVPLILTRLEVDDPLELGEGVRIERLDDSFLLAACRVDSTIEAVPTVVSNATTHAIVISGVIIDNTARVERVWRRGPNKISLEKVDSAIECLRVLANIATGYAQVLLRPRNWADRWTGALPSAQPIATYRRYPAVFDEYGWLKSQNEVSAAQLGDLPRIFGAAQRAGKATSLALRRLSLAGLRENEDDKLVDACIGIEALLSNDNQEMAHKISTRGALVLASRLAEPLDARVTFKILKKVYGRRSDLVHGSTKENNATFKWNNDQPIPTATLSTFLLRKLLFAQLMADEPWKIEDLDGEIVASFNPKRDEGAPSASGS